MPATALDNNNNNVSTLIPLRQETNFYRERIPYLPLLNVMILTGPKGSTKTCNLVRFGIMAKQVWKRPVFADFPYSGDILGEHFEPKPFPDDAFVTYCKDIPRFAVILVDELQEFFDRQRWMTVEEQMGVSVFQQIRKLGLTIIGATQFFHYLNPRINDQVDWLIRLTDMRLTDWGRGEGIVRGREALAEHYDLGGIWNPSARHPSNPHWISGEPCDEELIFTEPYWRFFDTTQITAIEHRFISYKIKKEKRDVLWGDLPKRNDDELEQAVMSIVNETNKNGRESIKAGELLNMLKTDGFDASFPVIGKIMAKFGIEKKFENKSTGHGFYYQVKDFKGREET